MITVRVSVPVASQRNVFEMAIIKTMIVYLKKAEQELNKPTANWSATTKPKWEQPTIKKVGGNLRGVIQTSDFPYAVITVGTKKKMKISGTGRRMRFQTGYFASTVPKKLVSRRRRRFGPYKSTRKIKHGIEARLWHEVIAKKMIPEFNRDTQRALNSVIFWTGRRITYG